jgi:hypothetical protein
MKEAKQIFEALPKDGSKVSEAEIKKITGLNLGKIKDAKKWLKQNDIIQSYRGRGGYFSLPEGASFPEEENTMSTEEKIAATREEKKIKKRETQNRRNQQEKIKRYVSEQFPDSDHIEVFWFGNTEDKFYVWVWKDKEADTYSCYASDIA